MRKDPFTAPRYRTEPRRRDTSAEDLVVRKALCENPLFHSAWAEVACPSKLLPSAAAAVKESMRLGRGGTLAPLPKFAEDVRTTRKDRANSTMREALAVWMASPEGQEWRRDKEALFPGATMQASP